MKLRLKPETKLYLVLWTLLFIVPVMVLYIRSANSGLPFQWHELLSMWRQFAVYLAIFILHNYLLAPLLVRRERRWMYIGAVAVLLGIFVAVQCVNRPQMMSRHADTERMYEQHQQRIDHDRMDNDRMAPPPPPEFKEHRPSDESTFMFDRHDIVATIILILMLGMNIGIKLYYRQRMDQQRLAELERENLEQQLEYLKYQINPHFLMNTLNNIHALIDIEPEMAKESIVELSKIMRFVLYDGAKQKVLLSRELLFIENYIQLMRIRLTDKVDIQVEMPERIPDSTIPPLMLITFVENAFKHGVSYRHPSYINIRIHVASDEKGLLLRFECENSKIPQTEDEHGGVGLANAKRRLELIYGNRYTLNITDADTYLVTLTLPLYD